MKNKLLYLSDGYKYSHKKMYPNGTQKVYSTWTPREIKFTSTSDNKVVTHGVKYLLHSLEKIWQDFKFIDLEAERETYEKITKGSSVTIDDWKELQKLDFMPLDIRYLKDGSIVDAGTAVLTIENTDERFFWFVNFVETYCSQTLWTASTTATHAREIYKIISRHANISGTPELVKYQGHDFSARGMSSYETSIISGIAHMEYFKASDTIAAVYMREKLYKDAEFLILPATEHSVMCAGGKETEKETILELIRKYPSGILSIVSDTWDYFNTISNIYKEIKDDILARDGKFVIRPDSGKPIYIICGKENSKDELERKGTLEILGDIFGYTINSKGYKVLHEKVGVIYGDGMNREVIDQILERMESMGWSSDNIIFGVGSYQYQYNTRDTLSYAQKATSVVINGERKAIFKEPKTDKSKKSQIGLTKVIDVLGTLVGVDETHPRFDSLKDEKEKHDFTKW